MTSASIIKLSDLSTLPRKALFALAIAAARDIDAGHDKNALLERLMIAIMGETRGARVQQ